MILTPVQNKAVCNLHNAFNNRHREKYASFKSPTGSGKTFMASELISRVFANEFSSPLKTIFIIATVSNAKLPEQFADKLLSYKQYHDFNDYEIEFIESPSASTKINADDVPSFELNDRKVFVFGTSSFGKGRIFTENRTLDTLIQEANTLGYELIFIRDEAHIGSSKPKISKDEKKFDSKMKDAASFVIEMTATPQSAINLVEITEDDIRSDSGVHLLKSNPQNVSMEVEVTNEQVIDKAIALFIKTKKDYHSMSEAVINPAMLIQLANSADYLKDPVKNKEYTDGLALLEMKLSAAGLKYLKYLDEKKEVIGTNVPATLKYASRNDSEIDVILFKVGPATGWDIPRANTLLQLRNVSSRSLNKQTVGRIMRNPFPGLESHPITNKYYIWSNYQEATRVMANYKLIDKFDNETLISGRINQESHVIKKSFNDSLEEIKKYLETTFVGILKDFIPSKDLVYEIDKYGDSIVKHKIENFIYLKIYNSKLEKTIGKDVMFGILLHILKEISIRENKNIEIVKYCFFKVSTKIKKIIDKNSVWIKSDEPYELLNKVTIPKYYSIWVDNGKDPKKVRTDAFDNYGYDLISLTHSETLQFLDSEPERVFFENFIKHVNQDVMKKIDFFAKMPSFGSNLFYEYFSKEQGKIVKSYMDFAMKINDRTYMIEVKSRDKDYDPGKTRELLDAYEMYMNKFKNKNIVLMMYLYDSSDNSNHIFGYFDGKWKERDSFSEVFNDKFFRD